MSYSKPSAPSQIKSLQFHPAKCFLPFGIVKLIAFDRHDKALGIDPTQFGKNRFKPGVYNFAAGFHCYSPTVDIMLIRLFVLKIDYKRFHYTSVLFVSFQSAYLGITSL
jgi:hypothetical protein